MEKWGCFLLVLLVNLVEVHMDVHVRQRAMVLRATARYCNSWAVQVDGGQYEADSIAVAHGFVNLGQIGALKDYYHFQLADIGHDAEGMEDIGFRPLLAEALKRNSKVGFVQQQRITQRMKRDHAYYSFPTDPNFIDQWSVVNTGQACGPADLDLNVEPVWLQGIDGTGVVAAVVDDGLEINHPDLAPNFDARASYDFVHNDSDPTPDVYLGDEPDSHGTECAGEIGMVKDNNKCGVGVAYGARIGGIKFNGNNVSDLVESMMLSHENGYIHVYSNSWGPLDDGFIVEGPDHLLQQTFENSVQQGRGGKGSIYVWASGNGGDNYDSCAADGYSSSIYTISVGSVDQNARKAYYDEECASKMAVTFSFNSGTFSSTSNFDPHHQITTTTLNGQCVDRFTGTSASTPLASAVIALSLQANSNLTWRDVQYLITYTSNPDILVDGDFNTNGAGLKVSHKFGFGAIDGEAMVTRARRWISVPQQKKVTVYPLSSSGKVYPNNSLVITFIVKENISISYLEHVVVSVSLIVENYSKEYSLHDYEHYFATSESDIHKWLQDAHPRRGDIKVELTSPQHTTSVLLPYRNYDFVNSDGYDNWPFTSVHHWGENPVGQWTLKVTYRSKSANVDMTHLKMTLHGTAEIPESVLDIPSTCDSACTRGCSGIGSESCDVCNEYRIAATLECVSECPNDTFIYKSHYCVNNQINASTKDISTICNSISSSLTKILIISISAILAGCIVICSLIGVCICCAAYHHRKRKNIQASYSMLTADYDSNPTPV